MSLFRRFGIEIEQVGLTESRVRDLFTTNRVSNWRIKSDLSIRGQGCEVVSPPLEPVQESLDEVRRVANILNEAGADINVSCGFHVHIDARGLNAPTIANVIKRYADHEVEIDSFMPNSRRGSNNRYARTMVGFPLRDGMTIQRLVAAARDRYYKINLHSYSRHGTLEFRQHSGTVDAVKIVNWVVFLQHFVEDSKVEETEANRSVSHYLNRTHRRLLDYFERLNPVATPEVLATHSGVSPNSARQALSGLRSAGYDVRLNRTNGTYHFRGRRTTGSVSAPVADVKPLWHSVPAPVHDFYEARKVALRAA